MLKFDFALGSLNASTDLARFNPLVSTKYNDANKYDKMFMNKKKQKF